MDGFELLDGVIAGIFGLLIGSFLNVVIHRLPRMMERQWEEECRQYAGDAGLLSDTSAPKDPSNVETYNLWTPRSRCPGCSHEIRWFENVPLLSYIGLRGRCAKCKTRISLRYPAVELATGALFFVCIEKWGWTPTAAMWSGFSAVLLALACIDWDTTLLPDDMTLPLLWAGLLGAALHWVSTSLPSAVFGAVAGYLSLWIVYWGFKLATGKEGMGYGDFKLFAALGAWFGWQALIPIILLASVIGAAVGITMKLSSTLREGKYVPFGPFLAGAGLTAMLWGPERIMQTILAALGI